MIIAAETLQTELAALVGSAYVQPATASDAIDGVQPQWVVAPGSAEEVTAVLRYADGAGLRVAPRGGGTKLAWGNPPHALDLILSTHRLDQVLEHAWGDMTATVQAGCTVVAFQAVLAAHGQRLALDPLWPEQATIGGILATNDSGALRIRFGALRDLIIGVTVALPNGTLARSGGKVVKNVAGYDLPKLMTGALGTLGVITEATFRLYPLPSGERSFRVGAASVAPLQVLLDRVRDSTLVPTGLQLQAGNDISLEVHLRMEGSEATLTPQATHLQQLSTAAGCGDTLAETGPEIWQAREALWVGEGTALVGKVSLLPTQLAHLCARLAAHAEPLGLDWRLIAQATGVGLIRLAGPDGTALFPAFLALRGELETAGGSLVILHCPPTMKASVDVWGAAGDALPLMQRVKAQFDPAGILNPGRFVGGI